MLKRLFQSSFIGLIIQLSVFKAECQTLKILPLGNSLTKGTYCTNGNVNNCKPLSDGNTVGYRYRLYEMLRASGYDFDFVGNEIAGFSIFPDYNHAGYPGYTSSQLAAKMNENNNHLMNSTKPDIVLLEIGTNDVYGNSSSITGVRQILEEIDEYESDSGKPVIVFLSKIIKFSQGTTHEELVNTFNSNLQTLYNQRKAAGDLIEWVDIGADLVNKLEPLGDMKDQLHPNDNGYDLMAIHWFDAINGYNTAPVLTPIPEQFTNEGESFNIILLDNYVYDAEDADASITWTMQSAPTNLDVTIDENRQLIVSPADADWNGSENITLVATDNGRTITALKKSVSLTIKFTVNPVNDPPVIHGQTWIPVTPEETAVEIFLSYLEIQDIDNEESELVLHILSGSNYSYSGALVTPAVDFNGELAVNIRVSDPESTSQTFIFKINVTAQNDPPVIISAKTVSFDEDTSHEIRLSDLQVFDPDNYYPADFTLVIGDGQYYTHSGNIITPELNYNGIIVVPVRVKDKHDLSEEYLYTMTVLPVNDTPYIIIPPNLTAYEDDYFEIYLEAYDVDQDDSPGIVAISLPGWLSFDESSFKLYGTLTYEYITDSVITMRVCDSYVSKDSTYYIKLNGKTGVDDRESNPYSFSIYPNPVTGLINIGYNGNISSPVLFRLFNVSGIHMLTKELTQNHTIIYLNNAELPQGVYFYEISGKTIASVRGKLFLSGNGL